MPNYQVLLLDADDTLLDFRSTERETLCRVFEELHIPCTEEIIRRYSAINAALWRAFERGEMDKDTIAATRFVRLFEEVGCGADGECAGALFRKFLGESAILLPDALAVCEALSQTHRLYIVTNGIAKSQHSRIRRAGLLPYLSGVFVSEEAGAQKPSAAYFDYVFAQIPDCARRSTLIVGDSLTSDIRGGALAGVDTCWFNPARLPNMGGIIPTYEIRTLPELYSIV